MWFNIFYFTCLDLFFCAFSGILNPEELSLINKGFKKSEISMLPPIEEPRISCESNCTTESDGSSLAEMYQLSEASCTRASSSRKPRHRNMQKEHCKYDSFIWCLLITKGWGRIFSVKGVCTPSIQIQTSNSCIVFIS